jgi:hypothetical protein
MKSNSIPILFADDINIIVKNSNHTKYENELTLIFNNINEGFKANNYLTLNLNKTHFMQFSAKK